MAKNLLIVESPAKAKTIGKYLGKDFEVKSSFGHIRDLDKEGMGIDIDNGFKPHYSVSPDKKKIVSELKSQAKKADEVWLATDEDREGEAISWHLCEVLGLEPENTKRIVFHEITKPAIQRAVANPRRVDMNLVNAQQARRVLDRIVGFEISPVLWRKLSAQKSLSAGRVQSVAVRLLVEREREINQFQSASSFKTEAFFRADDVHHKSVTFKAEGKSHPDTPSARAFLEKCIDATFQVSDVQIKPGKKTPSAPFTTSTLQQEASRKLGYSVSRTMRVAQQLYENGYISYMRTDSVNLSETAITNAREVIFSQYGKDYHQQRQYQTKNESAQEAHEAIRPTDLSVTQVGSADGQKLYDLIWKRTIASQMADARTERTVAKIDIIPQEGQHTTGGYDQLTATGEVLKFDGFLKVYIEGRDDEDEEESSNMLPPLNSGQQLDFQSMRAIERFTRPPARYTEASLVKKLEELGIGRPSTYAPTISTIQQRGYVEKKDREGTMRLYQVLQLKDHKITEKKAEERTGVEKSKLFPTDLGLVVTDFLNEHFSEVMDYSFTANIENDFDQIAAGEKLWNAMIGNFYGPFHQTVEYTLQNADRAKGERELGTDPESGKPVFARLGRFGPMIQIGIADDEHKPRFATLRPSQSIETITLEEALDLFKLPFSPGAYEEKEITIGAGRFGPYVKWNDQYVSIPRGEDPLSITLEKAIALIKQKQAADAPIATFEGKPVTRGKGRFGPYIKYDNLFINVPKAYNFDNLSQDDIETLINKKLEKEANRYIQQWPEEKIAIENGRWGPFIRFAKQMIKLGKKENGDKYSSEELQELSLEEVKKMIIAQDPTAFEKKSKSKTKRPAKKAAARKPSVKKK